jgi:hypothetical protein
MVDEQTLSGGRDAAELGDKGRRDFGDALGAFGPAIKLVSMARLGGFGSHHGHIVPEHMRNGKLEREHFSRRKAPKSGLSGNRRLMRLVS